MRRTIKTAAGCAAAIAATAAAVTILVRQLNILEGRIRMLEAQDRQQDDDIWDLQCAIAADIDNCL